MHMSDIKEKDFEPKDIQRGIWNQETVSEIEYKARYGKHRIRGCGATRYMPTFDDLMILPSQLSRMSIDTYRESCETRTVLGKRFAKKPLVIETPIMIAGMSYGALSKEAKLALAKATALTGTFISNGEGGLLPEEREFSYRQSIQVLPSRFGFSKRSMEVADALEILVGIGAKPGLSGHLMGKKITEEIASFRQLPVGIDLHSHPRHGDAFGADDLVVKMEQLRELTDSEIPIFMKIAAGRVKDDVKIAVKVGVDGIIIDGAQGGTGAMVAMGCKVCLRCHNGVCAYGIGTQNEELRKKLDIDEAAERVANYIRAMTNEAVLLAKAAGKTRLKNLEREDLRSMTLEACAMTGIPLVGTDYVFGKRFGFGE